MTRKQMIEQLEQYKMGNGYYDILAIENDENDSDVADNIFAAFFGDSEEVDGEESELVALARELNEQMANAKRDKQDAEATELIGKAKNGTATREDWDRLVEMRRAIWECLPDGITYALNCANGTAYSDQEEV